MSPFATEIIDSMVYDLHGDGKIEVGGYLVAYPLSGDPYGGTLGIGVIDGIVSQISVGHPSTAYQHQIGNLLESQGVPSEVRVFVDTTPWDFAVQLFLFYPELNFIASYRYAAELQGDQVIGCVQPTGGELVLLAANAPWTLDEFIGVGVENTKSIESATSLDTQHFYEAFRQADADTCLTTPASLWP